MRFNVRSFGPPCLLLVSLFLCGSPAAAQGTTQQEGAWFCCQWIHPVSGKTTCAPSRDRNQCVNVNRGVAYDGYGCHAFRGGCYKIGPRGEEIFAPESRAGGAPAEARTPNAPAYAAVLEIVGDVEIVPAGSDEPYTLRPGAGLSKGDRIVTGMDSKVRYRLADGSIIEIRELTDVRVEEFQPRTVSTRTRLWLKAGEVSAEVNPNRTAESDFAVKTPTAIAGVSGTRFTIRHNQQVGTTTISVMEGTVVVTPENRSSQSFYLRANQRVDVSANGVGRVTNVNVPAGTGGGAPARGRGPYTPEQINTMRQWIAHYDKLIAQWTQYRDQRVAPYLNDRTYYQWARSEYARCNQQIQLSQRQKAYYQNLLRQAGLQ